MPKIEWVFGPKVSGDKKKAPRRKLCVGYFRSKKEWEPNKIEKSLRHKLVEFWFHIIKWCQPKWSHPKMVTPEAGRPLATPLSFQGK